MEPTPTWLKSGNRIVLLSEWVALALGLLGSSTGDSTRSVIVVSAGLLAAAHVLAHTFTPLPVIMRRGLYLEILVISGAVLTVGAATLTGGVASPYVLLVLTPTLLGSIVAGHRLGLTTALFSAGLLVAVTATAGGGDAVIAGAGVIALFPLLALLVAQIHKLLVDAEQRASSLEEASVETSAELARLNQANDLLRRLTDVYGDGRTNPVELGRSTLAAIVDALPGSFATATLFDAEGPVVVARVGTDAPSLVRTQIPLGDEETTSGVVSLGSPEPLTPSEQQDINRLLRPVALSFANTVLLQDIAKAAVDEERLRLARELHDEIGPALAAVGLSLDVTAMQAGGSPLADDVTGVRQRLGEILEDIRRIIADLRAEPSGSLVAEVHRAAAQATNSMTVEVDIHEQRPPRPAVGRQLAAIITESMRNIVRHADASTVSVTGTVDRSAVSIEVHDDGKGFDTGAIPEGHYGLLGMRERADRIGAQIDLESGSGGTTIRVIWKEQR